MTSTPQLSRATARAFGVAGIRLGLAAATIGACAARGLSLRASLLGALLGGVVLAMIAFGQAGRANRLGEQEWLAVPPGARYDPAWVAALLACVPSTVGVAAMIAVALVASPALAGILAGVLLALGLLAVVSGLEIVARERRDGVRLWLGRGPKPARYRSAV